MAKHIPTTREVRDRYDDNRDTRDGVSGGEWEFDVWYERIQADAWAEGYRRGHDDLFFDREGTIHDNPYRPAQHDTEQEAERG